MMLQKIGFTSTIMLMCTALCAKGFPDNVQKYIENRQLCDHFRGEYPESEGWGEAYQKRFEEVNKAINKNCQGTDQALMELKQQYKTNQVIMNKLNEFEENIGL